MKKTLTIIALALAFTTAAPAQSLLGGLLGGNTSSSTGTSSSTDNLLGGLLNGLLNTVYSAPVSLNGTYTYNGVAISATSSDGNLLTNLAGTALTSGVEAKADEILAKVGIKPGVGTWVFNASDNTFSVTFFNIPFTGTYKVGEGENTVTLTFGKILKYLTVTGTLETSLTGATILFTPKNFTNLMKKMTAKAGQNTSALGSIAGLAQNYDTFRIGFKLVK